MIDWVSATRRASAGPTEARWYLPVGELPSEGKRDEGLDDSWSDGLNSTSLMVRASSSRPFAEPRRNVRAWLQPANNP